MEHHILVRSLYLIVTYRVIFKFTFYLLGGRATGLHVVVDSNLVTGQNEPSTLTAVQNLILLSNARYVRTCIVYEYVCVHMSAFVCVCVVRFPCLSLSLRLTRAR